MEKVPNGRYLKEFREEAVKLSTEGGLSVIKRRPYARLRKALI